MTVTGADLQDFIGSWSDIYTFWIELGMWHARRRDNAAVVHAIDPEDLCQKVMEDYIVKPVKLAGHDD
jgi:hypothetical protein